MWICISLFGDVDGSPTAWTYILAGVIFSLVNAVVKPIATILSLPFILLTIGLFTIILNAAMVAIAISFTPSVQMSFWGAVFTSLTISLINYLVNLIVPAYNESIQKKTLS